MNHESDNRDKGDDAKNGLTSDAPCKNPYELSTVDELAHGLDCLRSRLMDLEAMAHAAARSFESLPYIPPDAAGPERARPGGQADDSETLGASHDFHDKLGKIQTLVEETARTALSVWTDANELFAKAHGLSKSQNRHRGGRLGDKLVVYNARAAA